MERKIKLGKPYPRHGVIRNPQAKLLHQRLFHRRILPNKKKDVKPEENE
jgi:hypothetical protein